MSPSEQQAKNPFAHLAELASPLDGKILFATDDFFQVAESLILRDDPVWDAAKFTQFGKWMDGWETRRKRIDGHDWCILKLALPGIIQGVNFDTAFFTGNQTPRVSLQAACFEDDHVFAKLPPRRSEMGTACKPEELEAAEALKSNDWETILRMSPLKPGYPDQRHNYFEINSPKRWTHLRVNYYPDGGVARLRVYGIVAKDWSTTSPSTTVDLVALSNGGRPVSYSNAHYGEPFNMIQPGPSFRMDQGWETARNPNRPPVYVKDKDGQLVMVGSEHVVFALGHRGVIETVMVDTAHFKGNYPESVIIHGTDSKQDPKADDRSWAVAIPRSKLSSHNQHTFACLAPAKPFTHIKVTIYPDGGIARIRVYGKIVR